METSVKKHLEQGLIHYKNKDYDSAISCYSEAIRIDPDNVTAYNSRANLYVKKREYDSAIADYSQAVRINPNNANSYYGRGIAYKAKGNYKEAVSDLETALQIDPANTNAAYAGKCIEESRGKLKTLENDQQNMANEFFNKQEEGIMKSFSNASIEKFEESVKKQIGSNSKIANSLKSIKNRMGIGTPERNETDTYERRMNIVPECISANENEIPVKQYNIAVLRNLFKFERAEGRIQVTNKRVIFRAAGRSVGGRTTLQHEYAIDEIAGIEARNNYKFSFLYLIFAVLIITCASFIISGPSAISGVMSPNISGVMPPNISGVMSPKRVQAGRISGIMFPKFIQKAYSNESTAILQTKQAEENLTQAEEKRTEAQEFVDRITKTRDDDVRLNRRNTYSFRDRRMSAQEILDLIIPEKEEAEAEELEAAEQLENAKIIQAEMTGKRITAVNIWKVVMTLFGLVLGIGGLIPFFVLYKKFGLKLFILNFSIFGFALSLAASGLKIFNLLFALSVIVTLVCVFIFCFRPNLVISIKNKMGTGEGPVDIRCNENLNKLMELLSFSIVVIPIIIFWGMKELSNSLEDSLLGPIVQVTLPVIFAIILLVSILRFLQSKNNGKGTDTGFAEVIPTEETEGAIREIGAMIGDIQKLGDLGLEKWIKK